LKKVFKGYKDTSYFNASPSFYGAWIPQRTEGRGQKAEGRGQKAEDGRRNAEGTELLIVCKEIKNEK
jgi:hypothetical protein